MDARKRKRRSGSAREDGAGRREAETSAAAAGRQQDEGPPASPLRQPRADAAGDDGDRGGEANGAPELEAEADDSQLPLGDAPARGLSSSSDESELSGAPPSLGQPRADAAGDDGGSGGDPSANGRNVEL